MSVTCKWSWSRNSGGASSIQIHTCRTCSENKTHCFSTCMDRGVFIICRCKCFNSHLWQEDTDPNSFPVQKEFFMAIFWNQWSCTWPWRCGCFTITRKPTIQSFRCQGWHLDNCLLILCRQGGWEIPEHLYHNLITNKDISRYAKFLDSHHPSPSPRTKLGEENKRIWSRESWSMSENGSHHKLAGRSAKPSGGPVEDGDEESVVASASLP
jgi:hypothetical protein